MPVFSAHADAQRGRSAKEPRTMSNIPKVNLCIIVVSCAAVLVSCSSSRSPQASAKIAQFQLSKVAHMMPTLSSKPTFGGDNTTEWYIEEHVPTEMSWRDAIKWVQQNARLAGWETLKRDDKKWKKEWDRDWYNQCFKRGDIYYEVTISVLDQQKSIAQCAYARMCPGVRRGLFVDHASKSDGAVIPPGVQWGHTTDSD